MSKTKYTREELQRLNTPACRKAPLGLPEEIRITPYDTIATLFNNRATASCKPTEKYNFFNDHSDPGSSAIMA